MTSGESPGLFGGNRYLSESGSTAYGHGQRLARRRCQSSRDECQRKLLVAPQIALLQFFVNIGDIETPVVALSVDVLVGSYTEEGEITDIMDRLIVYSGSVGGEVQIDLEEGVGRTVGFQILECQDDLFIGRCQSS